MSERIQAEPLTAVEFAPFGSVIEVTGSPSYMINNGACGRYHDIARPRVLDDKGVISISAGRSLPIEPPFNLRMVERHPLGTQAFVPMNDCRFLVVVARDLDGAPEQPRAFIASGKQGVQYNANTWHGVLSPLKGPADFLIIDRIGPEKNVEEHTFHTPFEIVISQSI